MLHIWLDATDALCPCCVTLGLQEDTHHQLHLSDKEREELFDEEVLKFANKLANM